MPVFRPKLWNVFLLGFAQILLWGGSFFFMAILAAPVAKETGWPPHWIYGSLSLGIFISGLCAPFIGRWITRRYGDLMLFGSGIVIGAGLVLLSVAQSLYLFMFCWCIIGVGMAMGFFDALFGALNRHCGAHARRAIVHVTLVSGFCTTVTWPLTAYLVETYGWRHACLYYGILLCLCIWPFNKYGLSGKREPEGEPAEQAVSKSAGGLPLINRKLFVLLATNFTFAAIIMTAFSVQLPDLLLAQNIPLATVIGLGALIGPSQIIIRVLDSLNMKKHPISTAVSSTLFTLGGVVLLALLPTMAMFGVILYGMGNGMRSTLRGTLPLVLFEREHYAVILGKLAVPVLTAQALTPVIGGYFLHTYGASAVFNILMALGLLNVLITLYIKSHINRAIG